MTEHVGMEPRHAFEDWLRVQRALATLTPGMKNLVDVGCGSGRMWKICPNWILPQYIDGIEPDDELRALCEADDIIDVWSGADLLPSPVGDCDAVSFYGVLEHVDDPASLIMQYGDAKKMIFTVPNAGSFHREFGKDLGLINSTDSLDTQDLAVGHKRVYTLDTFLKLIHNVCGEGLGMKLVDAGTIGFKFSSNSDMMLLQDRWDTLYATAVRLGLCGPGKYMGADLYMVVSK